MLNNGHDHLLLPQPFLEIKEDNKLFSKIMRKESFKEDSSSSSSTSSSTSSSSSSSYSKLLYYGDSSGSVPFKWESQPGTPKHPSSLSSIPPLTPPPSYFPNSKPNPKPISISTQNTSKPKFFTSIFAKFYSKKTHISPALSSSSSSSSSSCSLPPTPVSARAAGPRRRSFSRSISGVRFGMDGYDDDDEKVGGSPPSSMLCFGFRN